jgi:hypothetical protein
MSYDASMPQVVRRLVQHFTSLWWQSDSGTLPLKQRYSQREQKSNEAHLVHLLQTLALQAKHPPHTRPERAAAQDRLFSAAELFAKSALGLKDRHIEFFHSHGLVKAATEFVQQARRFDPELSDMDIYQASRNVWTMCSLQLMMGQQVHLTPAIFAYSLLYPYSDNFLDNPAIPARDKKTFNERLSRRLADSSVAPMNVHEQIVWDLLGRIEGQFERARFPQVFESLQAIHKAQNRSVGLFCRHASPYEVDVLGISLEKGGTSVLADGYLVAGAVTEAQEEFLFGVGAFLQIVDDLQDVEQDRRDGLMTIFSQTSEHWQLDQATNRALHLGARVLAEQNCFDTPGLEPLQEMMEKSIPLFIVEAAGRAGKLYTKPYLHEIERHSPFRFSMLRKIRKRLARQRVSLLELFEAVIAIDDPP